MPRFSNFADLSVRRQSKCKFLATILQLLLATTAWNTKLTTMVEAAPAADMPMNSGDGSAAGAAALPLSAAFEEKRNWQALQGPWGKRALYSGNWAPETSEVDDDERLVPLFISNGHREDPFLKYSMMYLTNAGTLERLLNQPRSDEETIGAGYRYNDDLVNSSAEDGSDMSSTDDAVLLNEKRNWNKMNAAWGKRRQAPAWNKFRGAWGKREPGWNNLKGMWGKRASKDWQKLNGGWGKRAAFN